MFLNPANHTSPPQKIISLVPSITELLFTLGLEEQTIGITKFCIHPSNWFTTKQKIGGTKNINIQKIIALAPDLIIANKEENVKEQVEELASLFPVYLTDVNSYASALQMILEVGVITNRKKEAKNIAENIEINLEKNITCKQKINVAYLIWKDPYMTIGGDTFISNLLEKIGLENVYKNEKRYPHITIEDLQTAQPAVVLLSSEPYPFKEKHLLELKNHFPQTKILLADGEMFSWYGSRMLLMPAYFKKLIEEIGS